MAASAAGPVPCPPALQVALATGEWATLSLQTCRSVLPQCTLHHLSPRPSEDCSSTAPPPLRLLPVPSLAHRKLLVVSILKHSLCSDRIRRAPCPELSASTPHLSLAAAAPPGFSSLPPGFNLGWKEEKEEVAVPVARLQGVAEESQEEVAEEPDEQEMTEETAAEELRYSLKEEQGPYPPASASAAPWSRRSSAGRSSGASQRNASDQQLETEEQPRPFMEPPQQQQQHRPAVEAIGDSGAVASWLVKRIQMREQQQHPEEEGEGPDGGLELTLGAMGSRGAGIPEVQAADQWGDAGERLGSLPPGRLAKGSAVAENLGGSQEEEVLEASLRPYTHSRTEEEEEYHQLEEEEARYGGGAVSVEACEVGALLENKRKRELLRSLLCSALSSCALFSVPLVPLLTPASK